MENPTIPPQTQAAYCPRYSHAEVLGLPMGFQAWNEAERTSARMIIHSLQTVLTAVMDRSDETIMGTILRTPDDEEMVDSFRASLSCYMDFLGYLSKSSLPERARFLQVSRHIWGGCNTPWSVAVIHPHIYGYSRWNSPRTEEP